MRTSSTTTMLRLVLAAGTMAPIQGCSRWQVQSVPPAQYVQERRPERLQVRRHGGERIVLEQPWVEGDSLAGLHRRDTARVAVSDVQGVAVRGYAPLQTVGLAIVTAAVVVVAACAAGCESSGFGY